MTSREGATIQMPFDIDPIRIEQAFLVGAILGFLVFLLGLVGTLLGWWNHTGERLMAAGSATSLVLALGFGIANASRGQVEGVYEAVGSNGETLTGMDEKLDSMSGQLDSMDGKLDEQTDLMGKQLDVLNCIDEKL